MPETAEPWAIYFEPAVGEINDPLAEFLPPDLVQYRRAAIFQRAEANRQRREESELRARQQEAHEDYVDRWTRARRFELAARGRDPNDPANLPMTAEEIAARGFYRQDAENAEVERQAKAKARQVLEDAGLSGQYTLNVTGSLSPHPGGPVEPATEEAPPPASRRSCAMPEAAARAGIVDKIRAWRDRHAHRATTPTRSDDGSRPLDQPRLVSRSTYSGAPIR